MKITIRILRIDRVEGFRIGINSDKNQATSGIMFYVD
jgi:hypothetical protein